MEFLHPIEYKYMNYYNTLTGTNTYYYNIKGVGVAGVISPLLQELFSDFYVVTLTGYKQWGPSIL